MELSMSKCHWLSPYDPASPPNIGKAINDAIKQLNAADEDFVVHFDHDVLFLLPDTKARIIEVLSVTDHDILGCYTNRIRSQEQAVAGMFGETDISTHIACAVRADEHYRGVVLPVKGSIAAFLLCFKVKTWKQLGGFAEGCLNFDSLFSIKARRKGLGLGLMAGVYVLHLYRWGAADAFREIKHLTS